MISLKSLRPVAQSAGTRHCGRAKTLRLRKLPALQPPRMVIPSHFSRSTSSMSSSIPRRDKSSPSTWSHAISAAIGLGVGVGVYSWWTPASPSQNCIQYASRDIMLKAAREIQNLLGEDLISYDEEAIEAHGYSDWSTANPPGRPVAIVYPKTTEHVSEIAKRCSKYDTPMVPFGAGSSVEGNFSSPYSGICIDFTHMDQIVAFHPDDMDVVVQPGVNWVNLNGQIQDDGLFLPLDPSLTATIGGMVSTNCSGTNAFRYGTMKDYVINLTVVLADGSIIKTRHRPRKTSAGYNLTSFLIGAEGTLGFVTEITLKLAVIPEDTSVAVVSFPSIKQAAGAATRLIRSGVPLAALELMDEVQMEVVNRYGSAAVRKRKWDERPTLFLKFSGSKEQIQSAISKVSILVSTYDAGKFHFAKTKQDEADLWSARKEALWTMTSIKPEGHNIWSTDVAVPISRLAEIIDLSKEDSKSLGLFNSFVGHVGDGNFHQALMYKGDDEVQRAAVEASVHRMVDRAVAMEGTVSGEHAIGIGKKDCLLRELGGNTVGLMKTLKTAVDPKWLMNPGKIFDLPEGSKVEAAK